MNRIISLILFMAGVMMSVSAQTNVNQTYFPYPLPPGTMENFYDRCNYMTEHFWDNCNFKSAFSSHERLKGAFGDYVSMAAHANIDTVMMSINNLIKSVDKSNSRNLLVLGKIARATLLSDTSEIYSEQLYYPFAKAVAECRKIPEADRKPFIREARILGGTQEGMIAPNFDYVRLDGSKGRLSDLAGQRVLLFFEDPEKDSTHLLQVRLSVDYNLKQLIEKGYLTVLNIYPGKPDAEWIAKASELPSTWTVGSSTSVNDLFDLTNPPVIVYLTDEHKILSKTLDKDRLLNMLQILNQSVKQPKVKEKVTE